MGLHDLQLVFFYKINLTSGVPVTGRVDRMSITPWT
jgi:hypothetical protein